MRVIARLETWRLDCGGAGGIRRRLPRRCRWSIPRNSNHLMSAGVGPLDELVRRARGAATGRAVRGHRPRARHCLCERREPAPLSVRASERFARDCRSCGARRKPRPRHRPAAARGVPRPGRCRYGARRRGRRRPVAGVRRPRARRRAEAGRELHSVPPSRRSPPGSPASPRSPSASCPRGTPRARGVRQHLGNGQRTTSAGVHRVRRLLVAGEVALAVVLLVGALMALRSFRALVAVDAGFPGRRSRRRQGLRCPGSRYGGTVARRPRFSTRSTETPACRVRFIHGRRRDDRAGRSRGSAWSGDLFIENQPSVHGRELRHKLVTPGYLEAIPCVPPRRRTHDRFRATRRTRPWLWSSNAALARQFFPEGGCRRCAHRIRRRDRRAGRASGRRSSGSSADERQDSPPCPSVPEVFAAEAQDEFSAMSVAVRSARPCGGCARHDPA